VSRRQHGIFFLWNWRGRSPYRKTLLKQSEKYREVTQYTKKEIKKSKEDS
jgi:hypothetical protein